MIKLLIIILTTVSIFGQNFNVSVYGFSVAKATWNVKNNSVDFEYKTNGLAEIIWPAVNIYSTKFDSINYNFLNFTKTIDQRPLKQSISIDMKNDSLVYKKNYRIRSKPTKNLFSLLAMIQKGSTHDLDTKWLRFDHEGVLFDGRFISAGLDTININGENIVCNHYRFDIKKYNEENSLLDETDRLMAYSVKKNTFRQIWVERDGNRRIIKANITANGFPFEIDIQND